MAMKKDEFLTYDEETGRVTKDAEQAVRDDVEKNRWKLTLATIVKDWRLYLMLVPMLLVFLFWRYFPMYELLGCFKITAVGKRVGEQLFCGYANFDQLMFSGTQVSTDFWRAFRNTFVNSMYGLIIGFPIPIFLALLFSEVRENNSLCYSIDSFISPFLKAS